MSKGNEWKGIEKALDTLNHRGPDDQGIWRDNQSNIVLAHARLSIQDLSSHGHQPMVSNSGRYVIVFNGEVYNFRQLRSELVSKGLRFDGSSDTEVLLEAIEAWGLQGALSRSVGMFAFGLWDRQERTLTLARDRIGEKPLYYGWIGRTLLFASELKAMRGHPEWEERLDRGALALYLQHGYVPTPYSIYRGVYKLTPGTSLSFPLSMRCPDLPAPVSFWDLRQVAEAGCVNEWTFTDNEAVSALDDLLRTTIREKMISDVPLGAFLSGGIDSTTVTAVMQAESNRPVRTFSIGFHEAAYNEAETAKSIAGYLGTEHTELYVAAEQVMDVIPRLPFLYDEPFADSSQLPTFLISQMTRKHVTVALTGDGGDELFGGYNRYIWAQSIWSRIGGLPMPLRRAAKQFLQSVPPQKWDKVFMMLGSIVPQRKMPRTPGDKLHKLADVLAAGSPEEMYLRLVSHWHEENPVLSGDMLSTVLTDTARWANLPHLVQRMQYLDMMSYLPDDILTKVDRAAMGVSLETRVPFLDHRIVEFAWRVPPEMKIRDGKGKWLLRQVLDKYVPSRLVERPKMGFAIPLDNWLRGPLKDWAENLLEEKRLRDDGYLNAQQIRRKWREHVTGKRNWASALWNILVFQAWLDAHHP